MKPLGLNWKAGVALISGAAAKEIIVSTLGVLTFREDTRNSAPGAPADTADGVSPGAPADADSIPSGTSAGPAGPVSSGTPADAANGILSGNPAGSTSASSEALLSKRLLRSGDFTGCSAVAFMVFVLLYFPCIATLGAIAHETGSWKWAVASLVYNTTVAWIAAFVIYRICLLF